MRCHSGRHHFVDIKSMEIPEISEPKQEIYRNQFQHFEMCVYCLSITYKSRTLKFNDLIREAYQEFLAYLQDIYLYPHLYKKEIVEVNVNGTLIFNIGEVKHD